MDERRCAFTHMLGFQFNLIKMHFTRFIAHCNLQKNLKRMEKKIKDKITME